MTIKYCCDKCGLTATFKLNHFQISVPIDIKDGYNQEIDLCEECYDDFNLNFLKK
jgi:hypothetical protein